MRNFAPSSVAANGVYANWLTSDCSIDCAWPTLRLLPYGGLLTLSVDTNWDMNFQFANSTAAGPSTLLPYVCTRRLLLFLFVFMFSLFILFSL